MPPRRFTEMRHAVTPWTVSASSAITARRISVAVMPTSVRPRGSVVLVVVVDARVVVVGRGRVVVGGGLVVAVVIGGMTRVVPGVIVVAVVAAVVTGASVELV